MACKNLKLSLSILRLTPMKKSEILKEELICFLNIRIILKREIRHDLYQRNKQTKFIKNRFKGITFTIVIYFTYKTLNSYIIKIRFMKIKGITFFCQ